MQLETVVKWLAFQAHDLPHTHSTQSIASFDIQWNVSYPNVSGPNPVHNSEYSITLKFGKVYV